jgi:hypothetical protein
VFPQHGDAIARCVLGTAVGMMHDADWRVSFHDRSVQCCDRQARRQRSIQFPANHFPRERIQDHRQKHELPVQLTITRTAYQGGMRWTPKPGQFLASA